MLEIMWTKWNPLNTVNTGSPLVAQRLKRLPAMQETPGEGNGNPLQYSCLENPMDGGAWWATVHRVTKSWTQLSDFTFTFIFVLLMVLPWIVLTIAFVQSWR